MITITILYLYKIKLDSYRITNILTYVKKIKSKMQKFRALFSRKKSKKGLKFYYKLGIFLKNILLDFIKSMVLHKLYLKLLLGLNNASHTAIVMGALYSLMGILKPLKLTTSKNYEEYVYVMPFYDQFKFELDFNCKIKFRFINISYILVKEIVKLIRRRIKRWRIILSRA